MNKNKQHNVTITHEQWEIAQFLAQDATETRRQQALKEGHPYYPITWQDVIRGRLDLIPVFVDTKIILAHTNARTIDDTPPTLKK